MLAYLYKTNGYFFSALKSIDTGFIPCMCSWIDIHLKGIKEVRSVAVCLS